MSTVWSALPFLAEGLLVTLRISLVVVAISLVAGVLLGVALAFGPAPARWPIRLLSDVVRGVPILVLIFAVYYGLPALGFNLDAFWAAVAALSIFKTAQTVEIARGALQSVPRAQHEAGKAIGLRFWQRFLYVVAPLAVRRFLPPWMNSVTDAVKGSALASLVGVVDLTLAMQQVIGRTYEPMPLYLTGAAIYLAVNYALSSGSRRLERRFAYIRD